MRNLRPIPVVALAVAFALAAGVSWSQEPGGDATSASPRASDRFVIGVEDTLDIVVWKEEELTKQVKVRPDGMITLPLINDMHVVGKTPAEVRDLIKQHLQSYVRDPNVTVILAEYNSFRVYFLGEVGTQGPMNFYRPTRLLQGLATAGGFTEFAKKEITLIRADGDEQRKIQLNFKKLWSGEDIQGNILLRPGDTILVR